MEHIAAVLLVIGCSGDMSECRELPAPVPLFETAEQCPAEAAAARRNFDGMYANILVKCVAVDPAMEEEDAELVWDINPDGSLYASIDVPRMVIASGKADRVAQ